MMTPDLGRGSEQPECQGWSSLDASSFVHLPQWDNKCKILMCSIMVILEYVQKFYNTAPFQRQSLLLLSLKVNWTLWLASEKQNMADMREYDFWG